MSDIDLRKELGLATEPKLPRWGEKERPPKIVVPVTPQPDDPLREELGLQTSPMYQRSKGAIPEEDEAPLNLVRLLAASDDPVAEITRLNATQYIADTFKLDPSHTYNNLEEVSQYWLGKITPAPVLAQSIRNAWDTGMKNDEISRLAYQLRMKGGKDPLLEIRIQNIEKEMEPLQEMPRPWARNFFQWLGELARTGVITSVQSGPLMLKSYLAGGIMGGAAGATAGAMLSATPPGLMVAGISAGMSIPAITTAMASIGFVAGSTQYTMESMRGTAYWRMRQDGIPHNIAGPLSDIEGTVEGAMESMGELALLAIFKIPIPGVGKILNKMSSRIGLKLISTGVLGYFARAAARALSVGASEALEEVGQEFSAIATDMIAKELAGAGAPTPTLQEAAGRIGQAAKGGFLAGVVLGVPAAPIGMVADAKQIAGLKTIAQQIPTRQGFINSVVRGELEILESVADKAKVREFLGKVWDQQHPGKTPTAQAVPAVAPGAPVAKGAPAPATTPSRGPEGRVHTEIAPVEGARPGIFTLNAGDPTTGIRYGYVQFETAENRIEIENVVNETETDLRRELVLDLAARYPGQEIVWNPTDELDVALKEDLVTTNPRGPEAGLQWFEGVAPAAQQELTRGLFVQRMGELFTADTPEQAEAFGKLADTFAQVAGQSTEDWLRQYIAPEVTTRTEETGALLREKAGVAATRFQAGEQVVAPLSVDEFKGQVKAVFTALGKADFHHGIHEFFHAVERLALSPEQVKKFETALGKLRQTWTVEDIETLADRFEDYLATGKAPTEELRSVFQQIAAALKALVSFIRERLGGEPGLLSAEFQAAYDALFQKPESGLATAQAQAPPAAPAVVSQVEEGVPSSAEGATTIINPSTVPPEEVELSRITLSEEVPNFKELADRKGIIEPLKAEEYAPVGIAPVTLWERMDGRLELITGRHRLDLAQRLHLRTILAQIVREADGFTAAMAMTFDAEANIRDEQGSVRDYANYFRARQVSEQEASRRGLLDRHKGRSGFAIGRYAADGLYSLYRNAQISEAKAAAIAAASLGDSRLQSLGITKAKTLSADELGNFIALARQQVTTATGVQGDMFGFDDSLIREGEQVAKAVSAKKAELLAERQALSSAIRLSRGAQAKIVEKYGFKAGDTAAIQDRVDVLGEQIRTWENWTQDPQKMREARTLAGLEVSALMHEEEKPPEPPPFELVPFSDKLLRPKAEKVVQPIFDFARKTDVEIKDELDNLSLFHRDEELQKQFNTVAIKIFGVTEDPARGAWILSNGKMLDFDWETHKATVPASERYHNRIYHVAIQKVMEQIEPNRMLRPAAYTGAWKAGTLRLDIGTQNDVSVQSTMIPTPEQMQTIEYAISGKELLTLEINGTDIDERTLGWQTLSEPTIKDVRRFYMKMAPQLGEALYHAEETKPEFRPMIDQGIISPSGRVSAQSRAAALERTRVELFGKEGLARPTVAQPNQKEILLKQAAELRDLAARGMSTSKYNKEAARLEAEAQTLMHPEDWQGELLYGTPVDAEIYQQHVELAKGFESAEVFRADMEEKYGEPGEADIAGEKAAGFYKEVWEEAHKPEVEPEKPARVPIQSPVISNAPQFDKEELQAIVKLLKEEADIADVLQGNLTLEKIDKMAALAQKELVRATRAKVREEIKAAQDKAKAAQQLRDVRKKLIHDIMLEPGKSIQYRGYAEQIRIIQEGLDPAAREYRIKAGVQVTERTMRGYARAQSRRFFEQNPEAAAWVPWEKMERFYAVSLLDTPMAQLEEINDILDKLRKLGTLKRNLELTEQLRQRRELQNNLEAMVLRGEAPRKAVGAEKGTSKVLGTWLRTLTPLRVMGFLDGVFAGKAEGSFTALWQEYEEAWKKFKKAVRERIHPLNAQMQELGLTMNPLGLGKEWLGRKMDLDGFRYTNGEQPTLMALMYWHIGMQNQYTREALQSGNNIPVEVLLKGSALIAGNPKYKAMADLIEQDGNKSFPAYRDAYIDLFNEDLEGQDHYVTMVRMNISYKTREETIRSEMAGHMALEKKYVTRGSTHTRQEIAAEHQAPIRTDLIPVWTQSVTEQEAFIYLYPVIKKMHQVFASDQVTRAINQKYGSDVNKWLRTFTNDLAQADAYSSMRPIERLLRKGRASATIAWLAFNLLSVAKQTVGMFAFAADLGPLAPVYMLRASIKLAGGLVEATAGGHFMHNTWVDFVRERSEYIRNRQISVDLENLKNTNRTAYDSLIRLIGKYGMKPLEVMDTTTVCMGWLAMYDKVNHETNNEAKAIEAADATVMKNSPSARVQDLAEIYRMGEWMKFLTMFTSELNVIWNRLTFDIPLAFKRKEIYSALSNLVSIGVSGVVIAVASGALAGDDEEKKKKLLIGLFSEFIDCVPLIGNDLFNRIIDQRWQTTGVQFFPQVTRWIEVGVQLSQADWDAAAVKAGEATAFTVGLPWTAGKRVYTAIDEQNLWALLGMKKEKK